MTENRTKDEISDLLCLERRDWRWRTLAREAAEALVGERALRQEAEQHRDEAEAKVVRLESNREALARAMGLPPSATWGCMSEAITDMHRRIAELNDSRSGYHGTLCEVQDILDPTSQDSIKECAAKVRHELDEARERLANVDGECDACDRPAPGEDKHRPDAAKWRGLCALLGIDP